MICRQIRTPGVLFSFNVGRYHHGYLASRDAYGQASTMRNRSQMQYRRRVFPNKIRLAAVVLAAVTPLLGACGGSGGGGSSPPPPPPPPPPPSAVTVSGIVSYEFVPPNPVCQGLDFNSIMTRPIRGATVELLNSSSAVLATTTSGDTGAYSFTGVATNTMVSVRVRAELKRQGTPNWDVEVRDNVIDPNDPNPPVLGARPLYSIVGSTFDTGTSNVSRNLTATTGWDAASNSYTGNQLRHSRSWMLSTRRCN